MKSAAVQSPSSCRSGAAQSSVPGVVGMTGAASQGEARGRRVLRECGLTPGTPPGMVTGQSPGAGARMPVGSTVSLTVTSGRAPGAGLLRSPCSPGSWGLGSSP